MAFRKTSYRRRRPMRKMRRYARKARVPRSMIRSNTVYAKLRSPSSSITSTSATWNQQQFNVKLADFTNYSSYTNLFDSYQIHAFKVDFFPTVNQLDLSTQLSYTNLQVPRVMYFIDRNGEYISGSETLTLTNAGTRFVKKPLEHFSIYVKKPKFQVSVQTNGANANAYPKTGWLDSTNYNVQHLGLLFGISPDGNAIGQFSWGYIITAYVTFRTIV